MNSGFTVVPPSIIRSWLSGLKMRMENTFRPCLFPGPLPEKVRVMFEINQNWDWNEYWTNDRYPDDVNYLNNAQPAVVYEANTDMENIRERYLLKPIGHSHPTGATGELFTDLSTLTTALKIADSVVVAIRR